jgi:hypothetical protein
MPNSSPSCAFACHQVVVAVTPLESGTSPEVSGRVSLTLRSAAIRTDLRETVVGGGSPRCAPAISNYFFCMADRDIQFTKTD